MLNVSLRLTFILLLASSVLALFQLAPPNAPPQAPALVALVLYGPMLLMGLAAWRLRSRSLIWLCVLLLIYFCGFVIQCFKLPPTNYWGLWQTLLTVVLFVLAVTSIRRSRGQEGCRAP